jgi:hypothetical protein
MCCQKAYRALNSISQSSYGHFTEMLLEDDAVVAVDGAAGDCGDGGSIIVPAKEDDGS